MSRSGRRLRTGTRRPTAPPDEDVSSTVSSSGLRAPPEAARDRAGRAEGRSRRAPTIPAAIATLIPAPRASGARRITVEMIAAGTIEAELIAAETIAAETAAAQTAAPETIDRETVGVGPTAGAPATAGAILRSGPVET
jgi:hypothetical protein